MYTSFSFPVKIGNMQVELVHIISTTSTLSSPHSLKIYMYKIDSNNVVYN